jgi:hypothetical protein
VNWHKANKVELLLLPPERAKRLASVYSPRKATDMGWWDGEVILIWHFGEDPSRGSLQLEETFVGEAAYESCRSFLDAVVRESNPFPEMFDETSSRGIT